MLKPYVCIACEKVIIDQPIEGSPPGTSGTASLIGLFSKIIAATFPGTSEFPQIPPNAVVPKEWAIFSAWDIEPGDEKIKYIVCTQILYPDNSPFGEINRTVLKIEANKRSQNVIRIPGFPIGQTGFYSVNTWIEENEQKVFGPIEFKIEVEIMKPAKAQPLQ